MEILLLKAEDVILLEDRQRKKYDKESLVRLAADIKDNQLLHPPTIRFANDARVVCGGRRTKALKFLAGKGVPIKFNGEVLPLGMIPVLVANTNDPLRLLEIELAENKLRDNLTWQEEELALAEIAQLLLEKKRLENPEDVLPSVTVKEVAEAAEVSENTIRRSAQLVEHLEDPDVQKAKTRKEAVKIIEKKRVQAHLAAKAETTKLRSTDHQIAKGDCRELIKLVPSSLISVVVTDPPYGIDMHKDESWDGSHHEYDDTEEYALSLVANLIPEFDRVTKAEAHVYLFCDYTKIEKLRALFNAYRRKADGTLCLLDFKDAYDIYLGHKEETLEWKTSSPVFATMPYPMVWNKGNIAAYPRAEHWPRKSAEYIIYAIKGDKKHNKLDLCVLDYPQLQNQDHPAGKPLEVYEHLMCRSTEPGDVSLDCFGGQGNHVRAAHKNKRKSITFELSDTYWPLLAKAKREVDGEMES